jgi:protein-tyrosine phosphatase
VLDSENIPLGLVTGADNHMAQDFVLGLRAGRLLPLADSRYVLVEVPQHAAPPRIEEFFFELATAGYVPILTHPERLTWIKSRYSIIQQLAGRGVWMQITSGSLSGSFGRTARYWAERMLEDGLVHLLASDAHDMAWRPPDLNNGRELAGRRVGAAEAEHLVVTRPQGILANLSPNCLPMPGATVIFCPKLTRKVADGKRSSEPRGLEDQLDIQDCIVGCMRGISRQLQQFL